MNSKFIKESKTLILEITEEVDHHSSEDIRRIADNEITKYIPKTVVLDFNNVNFMDSAGIGVVLGRYKMIKMLGGNLEIINVNYSIKKIFDMSGITKIINVTQKLSAS